MRLLDNRLRNSRRRKSMMFRPNRSGMTCQNSNRRRVVGRTRLRKLKSLLSTRGAMRLQVGARNMMSRVGGRRNNSRRISRATNGNLSTVLLSNNRRVLFSGRILLPKRTANSGNRPHVHPTTNSRQRYRRGPRRANGRRLPRFTHMSFGRTRGNTLTKNIFQCTKPLLFMVRRSGRANRGMSVSLFLWVEN